MISRNPYLSMLRLSANMQFSMFEDFSVISGF